MEFAALDRMIVELEKEKDAYVKDIEARIMGIKECIIKMKEDYRNETLPEVSGMVDYLLERAKKHLGDAVIEASDISEKLMDDFYEVTKRTVDVKRVILAYQEVSKTEKYWFFFTDKEFYLWSDTGGFGRNSYSIYPYKAIWDLSCREVFLLTEVDVDVDVDMCTIDFNISLDKVLKSPFGNAEAIIRLLLDLRDFANRSEQKGPDKKQWKHVLTLP